MESIDSGVASHISGEGCTQDLLKSHLFPRLSSSINQNDELSQLLSNMCELNQTTSSFQKMLCRVLSGNNHIRESATHTTINEYKFNQRPASVLSTNDYYETCAMLASAFLAKCSPTVLPEPRIDSKSPQEAEQCCLNLKAFVHSRDENGSVVSISTFRVLVYDRLKWRFLRGRYYQRKIRVSETLNTFVVLNEAGLKKRISEVLSPLLLLPLTSPHHHPQQTLGLFSKQQQQQGETAAPLETLLSPNPFEESESSLAEIQTFNPFEEAGVQEAESDNNALSHVEATLVPDETTDPPQPQTSGPEPVPLAMQGDKCSAEVWEVKVPDVHDNLACVSPAAVLPAEALDRSCSVSPALSDDSLAIPSDSSETKESTTSLSDSTPRCSSPSDDVTPQSYEVAITVSDPLPDPIPSPSGGSAVCESSGTSGLSSFVANPLLNRAITHSQATGDMTRLGQILASLGPGGAAFTLASRFFAPIRDPVLPLTFN